MTTLLEVLQQADARRIAVGHFNVSDLVTLYGVVEAARARGLPVVVGASEAERRFIGVQQLVAIVQSLRDRGDLRSSSTLTTLTPPKPIPHRSSDVRVSGALRGGAPAEFGCRQFG
jgi:hypothetical protein